AAVGALLGVVVAYGMVRAMAGAFASTGDIHLSYAVRPASVVVGYTLGVLLTFCVVAFSAWRVSRMNIVSAIRNLGDPPAEKSRRRRWLLGVGGVGVGATVAWAAVQAQNGVALGFAVMLIILGLVPIARALGLPERA